MKVFEYLVDVISLRAALRYTLVMSGDTAAFSDNPLSMLFRVVFGGRTLDRE